MTRDDMNTLLYSYLSVYHNEQNEPFATRTQTGPALSSEREVVPVKDFLRSTVIFLTAVLLVSLITYAGFAAIIAMGLSVLT